MILEGILIVVATIGLVLYFVVKQNKRERVDFLGKHVVITGGSQGIGYELSIEAFKQGAHVSILARNQTKLNEVKTELESIKKQNTARSSQVIQVESVDISRDFEETKKVFDRIELVRQQLKIGENYYHQIFDWIFSQFIKLVSNAGPVDILINNAGITKCSEFSSTSTQDFENLMRVNYMGGVYCTKAVIDSMKSRRFGRILFVSSQAGQIGIYGYTAYSPTKFALKGLAESLQMEVKPYNIYVTLSFPPDTDTPGLKEENLTRPEENRLISESSGLCSSKEVALGIIKSIKKGTFNSYFGVNGFLLANLTCGAGPATTLKEAVFQLVSLPLCRLVAIILLLNFDMIVKSCFKKKTATR